MAFTTRKSLLAKVRSGDEISWMEFYNAYRPLVFLCGRDCGLTQEENEDLLQQVMCEIFSKDILSKYDMDHVPDNVVFQYDPSKGRFRHYLRGIIRNQALKIYHKRRPAVSLEESPEGCEAQSMPEENFDASWEREWRNQLYQMALTELRSQVKPQTFAAFEMYAIQNRPVEEVAECLNLSLPSVYTAKNRCIAAMKKIIENLDGK